MSSTPFGYADYVVTDQAGFRVVAINPQSPEELARIEELYWGRESQFLRNSKVVIREEDGNEIVIWGPVAVEPYSVGINPPRDLIDFACLIANKLQIRLWFWQRRGTRPDITYKSQVRFEEAGNIAHHRAWDKWSIIPHER